MFYVREDRDQRVKIRWLEFRTSREEETQRSRNGENGGSPFINDNVSHVIQAKDEIVQQTNNTNNDDCVLLLSSINDPISKFLIKGITLSLDRCSSTKQPYSSPEK